ncbi:hypothetical protein [Brevibacillus sp. FIR094]
MSKEIVRKRVMNKIKIKIKIKLVRVDGVWWVPIVKMLQVARMY